jgi:Flp pilus assembly protein TadG
MHSKKGNVSIEFIIGLAVLIPVIFIGTDLAAVVVGAQFNDATCDEAARVAAAGPPSQASSRAGIVISRAAVVNSSFGSSLTMIGSPTVNISGPTAAQLAASGGPVIGTVSVTTQVLVKTAFLSLLLGQNYITLTSTRLEPFTYSYPGPVAP